MQRLRELSIEEGHIATARTILSAFLSWARERRWPWRAYVIVWAAVLIVVAARPQPVVPPPPVVRPSDLAALYAHMPSAPVDASTDLSTVWATMRRTMRELNVTCLAAVHVGFPLRAVIVGGNTQLVNPARISGVGGETVSAGYETSVFYPDLPPVRMLREVPVAVRHDGGQHVFDDREAAHCVHHMLDQIDGVTVYQRAKS
tara:strand:- start:141 stop:746 length:606 start_codon:yes stop_codon:yes gene_type:complete